jgi:SAM-dependent methyltransferase
MRKSSATGILHARFPVHRYSKSQSTARDWIRWGEIDPYYAVFTNEAFRRERLTPAALGEFFRSGERHVTGVLQAIRSHIRPDFAPSSALDFGCGAGRIIIPLSNLCAVTGVDVSPGMLREAEKNAAARSLGNVRLTNAIDAGPYDLVHSYLVFQHIPVRLGMSLTARLLDAVSTDGIAALHYVYQVPGGRLRRTAARTFQRIPLVRGAVNALRNRRFADPPMEMIAYPVDELFRLFERSGFANALIRQTDHGGSFGAMIYLWRDRQTGAGDGASAEPTTERLP